ncbi:MAG: threonine synthase [Candidatus Puniceispirillales bacterium]
MKYISTRGGDGPIGFDDALLAGLARDGGLYLPQEWPQLSLDEWRALAGRPYIEVAAAIMARFTDGEIDPETMLAMTTETYAGFDHPDVAPLVPLEDNLHVLELFHGPTIAFKDYAMQFLSRAFDRALKARGRRAVILGATSGDTGSAALEAFQGRDFVDIFILFPDGRVSPIQQRQMTSVIADGAHAVAVEGDFDDCQDAVKALFRDLEFRDRIGLSAINSINWARLMPQIVYYATSALALGAPDRAVAFSIPTGNFGNIFAGYAASRMGLPIKRLICASNRNDILTRFFASGAMERQAVEPSLSPSMDIQVSSNFERLLFELLDRNGEAVAAMMQHFAETGRFDVAPDVLARAHELFSGFRLDDQGIVDQIRDIRKTHGMVLDPHSAVGVAAARDAIARGEIEADTPVIALACAHPAKFPDAVARATGTEPPLPPHLADLMDRPERMDRVSHEPAAIARLVEAGRRSPADG